MHLFQKWPMPVSATCCLCMRMTALCIVQQQFCWPSSAVLQFDLSVHAQFDMEDGDTIEVCTPLFIHNLPLF